MLPSGAGQDDGSNPNPVVESLAARGPGRLRDQSLAGRAPAPPATPSPGSALTAPWQTAAGPQGSNLPFNEVHTLIIIVETLILPQHSSPDYWENT